MEAAAVEGTMSWKHGSEPTMITFMGDIKDMSVRYIHGEVDEVPPLLQNCEQAAMKRDIASPMSSLPSPRPSVTLSSPVMGCSIPFVADHTLNSIKPIVQRPWQGETDSSIAGSSSGYHHCRGYELHDPATHTNIKPLFSSSSTTSSLSWTGLSSPKREEILTVVLNDPATGLTLFTLDASS